MLMIGGRAWSSVLRLMRNCIRVDYRGFAQRKKDSEWIYSTKQQEKQNRLPGYISLYTHVNHDIYNASLRFIEHVERANIILTSTPQKIHKYLQSFNKKQRFVSSQSSNSPPSTSITPTPSTTSLQLFTQHLQNHTLQFTTEQQISKFIEMQKEQNKYLKQSNNTYIHQQAKQLKIYMENKFMEKQLNEIKAQQGYPAIFELGKQLPDIEKIHNNGFHLLIVFCDDDNNITQCSNIIKYLQTKSLPYQILPCTDQMITAIVSSGLPADRFSIEYLPKQNIEALLTRRSTMKITMCILIETSKLDQLVKSIIKILGKQHIVYLHGQGDKFYRGEVIGLEIHLNSNFPQQQTVYLVLAPRIPQFNQTLKSQLNKKSHIKGQLLSMKLNQVQMDILVKKLNTMQQKQQIFQIDTHLMTSQLLARISDENIVKQCLKKLLPRKNQEQILKILNHAKQYVVVDHIGIKKEYVSQKQ